MRFPQFLQVSDPQKGSLSFVAPSESVANAPLERMKRLVDDNVGNINQHCERTLKRASSLAYLQESGLVRAIGHSQ